MEMTSTNSIADPIHRFCHCVSLANGVIIIALMNAIGCAGNAQLCFSALKINNYIMIVAAGLRAMLELFLIILLMALKCLPGKAQLSTAATNVHQQEDEVPSMIDSVPHRILFLVVFTVLDIYFAFVLWSYWKLLPTDDESKPLASP